MTGFTSCDEVDREHARRARPQARTRRRARATTATSVARTSQRLHRCLNVPARDRPKSARHAVAVLEPLEDLDQQLEPVAVDAPAPGQGAWPTLTPIPSTTCSPASARMPATFLPSDQHVVRLLDRAPGADRAGDCLGCDERQLGPARHGRRRAEDDRHREPAPRLVDPHAPEAAAPGGLVLGERHRAVRRRLAAACACVDGASIAWR